MAAGRHFIARVLDYVANQLIVERLANSPSFQRFAVRSAKTIQDMSQKGAQKTEQLKDQLKDFLSDLKSQTSSGSRNDLK